MCTNFVFDYLNMRFFSKPTKVCVLIIINGKSSDTWGKSEEEVETVFKGRLEIGHGVNIIRMDKPPIIGSLVRKEYLKIFELR